MRATDDGFARARRALGQVDAEVDLDRLRAVTAERDRADADLLPLEEGAAFGVEILRTGQRPTLPRRRAAAWALAAAVALLCGAGIGIGAVWPGTGETPPGSQLPASPAPRPSREPTPENNTTTDPRECTASAPVPSAFPSTAPGRSTDTPASGHCSPSPAPSAPTDRAEP